MFSPANIATRASGGTQVGGEGGGAPVQRCREPEFLFQSAVLVVRAGNADDPRSGNPCQLSGEMADAARGGRHHDGVIRGDLAHLEHSEVGGKSVVAEHAEVVMEGASCAHGPDLCDRDDRVVLPTCKTRDDRPGCRAGGRSIDHLAD
jgi:hypothetical protein